MNFKAFREFEYDFWNVTAEPYDTGFGHVTSQAIPFLLDHTNIKFDGSLLDLACGPGYVTKQAKTRRLNVTGIDFSKAMIDLAQKRFPEDKFQVADAEDLPFEDNSFDGICSNFGMLHFSNAQKVIEETWRVCKRGTRFAFSVWNALEFSPAMNLIMQAVEKYATSSVDLPEGPQFFQFAHEQKSFVMMTQGGFKNLKRSVHEIFWPITSALNYVNYYRDGGARIGAILRAQNADNLKRIVEFIDEKAENYADRIVPASVVVTSGQK